MGADPARKTNVFVLHAIGGAGKSAVMRQFLDGLADGNFHGATKVYAWSAYSQGSGDNRTTSADDFIVRALTFFGHDLAHHPIADAVERGRRLASLISVQRALLIIDGLEPLQNAPHSNGGKLKDRGLAALITTLAANNGGLLLITSRQELPELGVGHEPRIITLELDRMDVTSGVALLAAHGVIGRRAEMEKAVDEVLYHALSLNLLGTYLAAVHGGDINQRGQFHLGEIEEAEANLIGDATARYAKRAARIMEGTIARFEALEGRMAAGGEAETAILHMVGLFDRPTEHGALEALLSEPVIRGLTDAFHELPPVQRKVRWGVAVERLRKLKLLAGEDRHHPGVLDAHPIVRAHFGDRLKVGAAQAYTQAHSRLYDFYRYQGLPEAFHSPEAYELLVLGARASYIRDSEPSLDGQSDQTSAANWSSLISAQADSGKPVDVTKIGNAAAFDEALKIFQSNVLANMKSCFSAIAHGCASGLYGNVFNEVYAPRVQRGYDLYIVQKLGAPSAALAALAPFFDNYWNTTTKHITGIDKAEILSDTAFALWSPGRLREAIEPFDLSLEAYVSTRLWKGAAIVAKNVAELHLTLGNIAEATAAARLSVTYADESGQDFERLTARTTLADVLHQAGMPREASLLFVEAEEIQAHSQSGQPQLTALYGYRYCDLLLAQGKTHTVLERSTNALRISRESKATLLTIGVSELSLGRCFALLTTTPVQSEMKVDSIHFAQSHLDAAVDGLRRAAQDDYLPRGLLDRAAFRRSNGDFTAAAADLGETYEIAYYGEMRLHLTDYHLETARLLLAQLGSRPIKK